MKLIKKVKRIKNEIKKIEERIVIKANINGYFQRIVPVM